MVWVFTYKTAVNKSYLLSAVVYFLVQFKRSYGVSLNSSMRFSKVSNLARVRASTLV